MKFFQGHKTDSVLGRTGGTLDWPKSVKNFDPEAWNNYTSSPPRGTDWRDHLKGETRLVARNAVKPFAVYFERNCNLVLLAGGLFESVSDWSTTLTGVEAGEISFAEKRFPYFFGSLLFENVLRELDYSPNNVFSRFDRSRYHIHGTRVQRGEETSDQIPASIESDLVFSSGSQFSQANHAAVLAMSVLVPQKLELRAKAMPTLFSNGPELFVEENIAEMTMGFPTPGISFPYPPLLVTNSS